MCVTRLLNSYPSVMEKDRKAVDNLIGQLTNLFVKMDPKTAEACLEDYPLKNMTLTAYHLNTWLEERIAESRKAEAAMYDAESRRRREQRQIAERDRTAPTPEERENVKKLAALFRECSQAMTRLQKGHWPKINGNPVPPNLVLGDDGLLHLPIGKYSNVQ